MEGGVGRNSGRTSSSEARDGLWKELSRCKEEPDSGRERNLRLEPRIGSLEETVRNSPDPYHYRIQLGLLVFPFLVGTLALADAISSFRIGNAPRYAIVDALLAPAGLTLATWGLADRFWKFRDRDGIMIALALAMGGCLPGLLVGLWLVGLPP